RWSCPRRAGSAWSCFGSGRAAVEGEVERRALAGPALGPDPSAVAMHDALHARQPDPGARELADGVQALERREQLVGELHVEPGAVIADEERALVTGIGRADLDPRVRH